jgi:hypothetical protein
VGGPSTRITTAGPSPRNQAALDIWEWDGSPWQQTTSSASTGTVSLGVAYDEKTAALYLFSLTGTAFSASRWNGTAVTEPRQLVSLGSNPGGFLFYARTCDLTGATSDPQTWRWDGATWTRVTGTQPPLRLNAAMAYDRDRNRVVLYGGEVAANTPDLADTWEFDGTAWARR